MLVRHVLLVSVCCVFLFQHHRRWGHSSIAKDEINVPLTLGAFRDKVRDFGRVEKKEKRKKKNIIYPQPRNHARTRRSDAVWLRFVWGLLLLAAFCGAVSAVCSHTERHVAQGLASMVHCGQHGTSHVRHVQHVHTADGLTGRLNSWVERGVRDPELERGSNRVRITIRTNCDRFFFFTE